MSIRLKDTIYNLVDKSTKDGSGNTITSTYLKLSGGTMTFTSINDFILKKTGNLIPMIAFQGPTSSDDATNIKYGYLGFNGADNPVFGKLNSDRSGVSSYYKLIHEGNYTTFCAKATHTHSYLPLAGGTMSANGSITMSSGGNIILYNNNGIYNQGSANGILSYVTSGNGWTGATDLNTVVVGGISQPVVIRTSGNNLYHYNDTNKARYIILDASNYSSYAATSTHKHGLLHNNFTTAVADTDTDTGWLMIDSTYSSSGYFLKSLRMGAKAPAWLQNNYSSGIAFGGADTKGVISLAYSTPGITFAGGNGTGTPKWYIKLTGTTGTTYNLATLAGYKPTNYYWADQKITSAAAYVTPSLTGVKIYESSNKTNRVSINWDSTTGSATSVARIYAIDDAGSNYRDLSIGKTTGELYYDASAGLWGLGNTTPSYKLHITGSLGVTAATTISGATSLGSTLSVAGTSTLKGAVQIRNSSANPYIYFQDSTAGNSMGVIYDFVTISNSAYTNSRFMFRQYSYTTGTTTRSSYYENYYLPQTAADLTANATYYILTTKNTSASGYTIKINGTSVSANHVYQSESTTANYRALMLGTTNSESEATGMTTAVNGQAYLNNSIYAQPSTGSIFANTYHINGSASSTAYLGADDAKNVWFNLNGAYILVMNDTEKSVRPGTSYNNVYSLGTSTAKWKNVYATTFTGALSGNADSSTYTTYIRVTETEPTSGTYYYPIWTTGMTSGSNYTPRANDGFRYYSLEGTTSAKGTGLLFLGNSTAEGTAGNKEGRLGIYGPKSYYAYLYGPDTATGSFYFPNTGGTLVTHATRGTAVGAPQTPVYIAASGRATACTIAAGSGNTNRSLVVTNGSNGMYYTSTITGNYATGSLISTVSDTTSVSHTCTNSNGSVSLLAATNRGLYDTTNSAWIIYLTTAADHVYVPKWKDKGSSTSPVYFNSSGEPAAGSTYAGGTKVTLNGTAKGASTASFYAPTGAGTSGQFLQSTGGVPSWVSINYYNANTSRTANTVLAAPNGSNGVASFRKLVAADLPTMYWANVAISSSSSTTKAPTFANVTLGTASSSGTIKVLRDSANYIICGSTNGSGGCLAVIPDAQSASLAASDLVVSNGAVYPGTDSVTTLGKSANYWSNTYSDTVTTTLVTNSAAVAINSATEVHLKYNNTNSTSIVLNSTAFKPFTAATSKLMLGNSSSLWKGIYTSINTSSALNNVGLNYCNSSGIIVGCMASSSGGIGIYSTGSIYLRGGCTASTSAGTVPTSSGTGLVINSTGNASANNFTSTVATGTRPLIVTSTTKCTNLNADFWDGYHLSVVTALPSSPGSTTIYFIT